MFNLCRISKRKPHSQRGLAKPTGNAGDHGARVGGGGAALPPTPEGDEEDGDGAEEEMMSMLNDGFVSSCQMFVRSVLDRAHGFTSPLVMNINIHPHAGPCDRLLFSLIISVVVFFIPNRRIIRERMLSKPLATHFLFIYGVTKTSKH